MRDFSKYSLSSLEQMIENYRRKDLTGGDDFAALLRAREAWLEDREPDIFKSLTKLMEAARAQQFVSYGDLAVASGMAWTHTLRARMSGSKSHLDRLLDVCSDKGLPLLTAICVNKENLQTGRLEPAALSGFVAGARRLGHAVSDEAAFLRDSQAACFAWGREQNLAGR